MKSVFDIIKKRYWKIKKPALASGDLKYIVSWVG